MIRRKPPRHGLLRPYRADTGAANAEEKVARESLARGDITLVPRLDGWAEAFEEEGTLTEALILDRQGRPIDVWDDKSTSQWMWDGAPRPPAGWLAGLRRRLGLG